MDVTSAGRSYARSYEGVQRRAHHELIERAACMFGPWGRWEFRYKRSELLDRDATFPDRIAAIQRIDGTWQQTIGGALCA
jgi:hypothetical protein